MMLGIKMRDNFATKGTTFRGPLEVSRTSERVRDNIARHDIALEASQRLFLGTAKSREIPCC